MLDCPTATTMKRKLSVTCLSFGSALMLDLKCLSEVYLREYLDEAKKKGDHFLGILKGIISEVGANYRRPKTKSFPCFGNCANCF